MALSSITEKVVARPLRKAGAVLSRRVSATADSISLSGLSRDVLREIAGANRAIFAKRPDLLKVKYQKMAESPLAFFRGSAPLFYADLERLSAKELSSGQKALIVGDLHVEQLASLVRRDGKVRLGIADFDDAVLGPAKLDLRRFATSIVLSGHDNGLTAQETHELVRRFATSYRDRMKAIAEEGFAKAKQPLRGEVKRFLTDAASEDVTRWLDKLAPRVAGSRKFARDAVGTAPVSAKVLSQLESAFDVYKDRLSRGARRELSGYRITDAVSAVSGTGSIGRGRFRLLLDKADAQPIVLEIKEQQSSVLARYLKGQPAFASEADRVVKLNRAVRRKLNPFLGSTKLPAENGLGSESYMVRRLYPTAKKVEAVPKTCDRQHRASVGASDHQGLC
jgi:uncharacterized protein (DUF2252 family)